MARRFEFLASNIETMTTAYRSHFCNWFILIDNMNHTMEIAYIGKPGFA